MLLPLTLLLFAIVLITVAVHYFALFQFLNRLKQKAWNANENDYFPKTMVLFPLRGADPSLPRGLEKILTQDYPNYHIRFILDSADDSARPFVESAIEQWDKNGQRAEIKIMTEHFATCSLKCSALYHGIADLDASYEAVVILDADTNPPNDWLKRLVEPLSDPNFPVATGLRWYIPHQPNAGSLARYLWNAAAVVQQELYRIPWGGSLALRRDFLLENGLLERWKQTLTDDTPITSIVHRAKKRIALVPSLFLVNRETCGLRSFHTWVKRQMLMAKLYHPAWGLVCGQAVLITLPVLLLAGTFISGVVLGNTPVIFWSLGTFLFYWAGVFGTLPMIEHRVRQIVKRNGEVVENWSIRRTLLTFAMVPITQGVYASALFWLHFLHRVDWRGIEYEVTGGQIRMIEYKPYTARHVEAGRSL
ncbi:MAG: glycosyltransferase family 2 protein [Planctomycetaceae bacterium]|nr:glycosyltransferase family 2 protein [Planctomycetaceae bacterium]